MTSIATTSYPDTAGIADFAAHGVDADDRIGDAVSRPKSKTLRRLVLLLGILGASAASYVDPSIWTRAWDTASPWITSAVDAVRAQPTKVVAQSAPAPETRSASQLAPTDAAPAQPVDARAAFLPAETPMPSPLQSAALPPITQPVKNAERPIAKAATQAGAPRPAGEAYAPPKALPSDPLAKRAEQAGLHADLSPALLKRFSDADFKLAAVAIDKALKETGDTETFIWPQKSPKNATRFRISFVQGAPDGCRRYVVEIAKDGWQTTALPVEKCGVRKLAARK